MKILLLSVLIVCCVPSQGRALEIGADQPTIGRKRALMAWELTWPALYTCLLQYKECQIDKDEQELLLRIANELSGLDANKILVFKSAKENPEFFDLASGSHRLARTDSAPGSAIFLNADSIDAEGKDLRLQMFVSIFVHELGHHQGLKDTDEYVLDQLGNKVARVLEQNLQRLPAEAEDSSAIEVIAYNQISSPESVVDWDNRAIGTFPKVFATDGNRIFLFSNSIPLLLDCPYGSEVRHSWVNDLHWRSRGVVGAKEVHYCLMQEHKKALSMSYFVNLNIERGVDGKSRIGTLPDQQMVFVPLLELESDRSVEGFLGLNEPPKLLTAYSAETSPARLERGGAWSAEFEVAGDPSQYSQCSLLISSNEFGMAYPTGQKYAFESDPANCVMKPLKKGRFRVRARYEFSESSPKRTYFLKALRLQSKQWRSSEGVVLPNTRQEVVVGNAIAVDQTPVTGLFLSAPGQSTGFPGFIKTQLCRRFDFQFELAGGEPLIQAHLKYTIHYRDNILSPMTLTDRLTWSRASWRHSSEMLPRGTRQYRFNMRFFHEFMEPEHMTRIEFRELTVLTQSLKEHRFTFPRGSFGLDVFYRLGGMCEP